MPTHLDNEATLVADARAGDAQSFTRLVRQYDRNIYRVALNITGNHEDAEDVLQDAMLKAYEKLEQFQGDSRFYTWLVRITVNEALMKLRKRRGASWVSLDEPVEGDDESFMPREVEDWHDNPEQQYAKDELQRILASAIESLELPYRTVFLLRDAEGLSTEETAEALGISVPAVKSRLLRARLKLRERLNRHFRKG
jgi:RNA polymerase sigma-70 factor (ECF subfamily)